MKANTGKTEPVGDPAAPSPGDERRCVPRYAVDTRLFASIDGRTVRLRNISRQGVAIHCGGLEAGSAHLLEVHLNRQHMAIPIEILDCSGPQLAHARFLELSPYMRQAIFDYINELA